MAQFVSGSRGESRGEAKGSERAAMSIFPPGIPAREKGKFVGIPNAPLSFLPVIPLRFYTTRVSRVIVRCHDSSSKKKKESSWAGFRFTLPRKKETMLATRGGQAFKVMHEGNWTIRFERQISGAAYPMQLYLEREREREWIKGVMQSGLSRGIIQRCTSPAWI